MNRQETPGHVQKLKKLKNEAAYELKNVKPNVVAATQVFEEKIETESDIRS